MQPSGPTTSAPRSWLPGIPDYLEPQPPPQPGRGDVWMDVCVRLIDHPLVSYDLHADMLARHHQGIARYGVPLQYGNGRDHHVDAYQESLDLVAYLHAAGESWWLRWGVILLAALLRRRMLRRRHRPSSDSRG